MAVRTRSGILGLYLFLVFASGAVVGGFGHKLYSAKAVAAKVTPPPREDFKVRYMRQMKTKLNLDEGQMQKMEVIFEQYGPRYRDVKQRSDAEMKRVQEQQRGEIKAMLRDEQQPAYQKMIEERDARDRERKAKEERR